MRKRKILVNSKDIYLIISKEYSSNKTQMMTLLKFQLTTLLLIRMHLTSMKFQVILNKFFLMMLNILLHPKKQEMMKIMKKSKQ